MSGEDFDFGEDFVFACEFGWRRTRDRGYVA
jgi:hypothetical protein